MDKYQVSWINDGRVIPAESISFNEIGIPIHTRRNPAEELSLFFASEKICQLARENPGLEFIIECFSDPEDIYYWTCKKDSPQYYSTLKIDAEKKLIPIRAADDEHFTLAQASQMICKMAKAYPEETFEIFEDSPMMAKYIPY